MLNIGWIEYKDGLTSSVEKYFTLADFVTFLNKMFILLYNAWIRMKL